MQNNCKIIGLRFFSLRLFYYIRTMIEELMVLRLEAEDLRRSGDVAAAEKIEAIINRIVEDLPLGSGHGGD